MLEGVAGWPLRKAPDVGVTPYSKRFHRSWSKQSGVLRLNGDCFVARVRDEELGIPLPADELEGWHGLP